MNRLLVLVLSLIALVWGAAFAAGCGNTLDHGIVTGAHYAPPETTTICSGSPTLICFPSTSEPDWWLDLKNCNPDPKTEKVKCVTGTYDVSEATYHSAKIGDHFDARGKN